MSTCTRMTARFVELAKMHLRMIPDIRPGFARKPHSSRKGLSCGIIGCGTVFRNAYAPALNQADCPMVCRTMFNPNGKSARSACRHLNYKPFICDSIDKFFDSGIDCVLILSPNDSHYEYMNLAIDRGLHIFCEKPLSSKSAEIFHLSKRNTKCVTVGYCLRYDLRLCDTGKALKNLQIVNKLQIHVKHEIDIGEELRRSKWLSDRARVGGGVLHNCGIHMINLLNAWFGRPEIISARLGNKNLPSSGGEDWASCVLHYSNNTEVTIEAAYLSSNTRHFADITATDGTSSLLSTASPSSIETQSKNGTKHRSYYPQTNAASLTAAQIKDFVYHIEHGTKPSTDIEDSLLTQECIEACYSAAQNLTSRKAL